MPWLACELLDNLRAIAVLDRATDLVEDLLKPGQAFGRRIDRAVDERRLAGRLPAGRPAGPRSGPAIAARADPFRCPARARRIDAPRLGRTGDHDVARLRIAEHVFQPREAGEVKHAYRRCPRPSARRSLMIRSSRVSETLRSGLRRATSGSSFARRLGQPAAAPARRSDPRPSSAAARPRRPPPRPRWRRSRSCCRWRSRRSWPWCQSSGRPPAEGR